MPISSTVPRAARGVQAFRARSGRRPAHALDKQTGRSYVPAIMITVPTTRRKWLALAVVAVVLSAALLLLASRSWKRGNVTRVIAAEVLRLGGGEVRGELPPLLGEYICQRDQYGFQLTLRKVSLAQLDDLFETLCGEAIVAGSNIFGLPARVYKLRPNGPSFVYDVTTNGFIEIVGVGSLF